MLLIRLTALGDVVLLEPVVRALRATFPGVAVDLVTEVRHSALMAERAGLDVVVPYDRRGANAGWRGMGQVVDRLPAPRYDAVIDLQGKLRTRLLALRVPAARRVTLRKRSLGAALLSLLGRDPPLVHRHAVDLYLDSLAPLGVAAGALAAPPRPALSVLPAGDAGPPAARAVAADRRASPVGQGMSAPGLLLGLGAGTTHATKQWPAARFAALADRLAARFSGLRVRLIGGPADVELLAAIAELVQVATLDEQDVTGLDVAELAGAIAELDLLVGVDSGPAHLAAALGVPVVAIFGPTPMPRWGPRSGAGVGVSLELPCSPCSNFGGPVCPQPERNHACMQDLDVSTVLDASIRLLAERGVLPSEGDGG